ncbi:MAG TPA: hypothetical protein PKA20_07455 [Burkholderiaceae bacterium]|nr:hypothetical protein [Burkholderiaceae bacterium]
MDSALKWATAERSVTKFAGAYSGEEGARNAASRLEREAGLQPSQIRLLRPSMARTSLRSVLSRQIEPEDRGIWRTLVKAHLVFGAVGLALGGVLYALLRDIPAVQSSPLMSFGAIMLFSTIAGLLLGGLVSLRPDHYPLMARVRRALSEGDWVVVVHPRSDAQSIIAASILDSSATHVFRTL